VGSDQVSYSTTTLHGVTFQKTVFVFTAAITSHYKYKIILSAVAPKRKTRCRCLRFRFIGLFNDAPGN